MEQPTATSPLAIALSDDLTGTLGLSTMIANENIPVRALVSFDRNYDPSEDRGRVVVVNTNSRGLSEAESRKAVSSVINSFPEAARIVKRFDTTLRGHLGAELSAIMAERPQAAAIIVPSYPASGRLCIGGYQMVNGIPVDRTEVGSDPGWPISNSFVPGYFECDGTRVNHISLEEVNAGFEVLNTRLQELVHPGTMVLVDACSDGDIAMIARATALIDQELILVSPGAFISIALGMRHRHEEHRIVVAVIGSTTEQTRRQVSALEEKYTVSYLNLPVSAIVDNSTNEVVKGFLDKWDPDRTEVLVVRTNEQRASTDLQQRITHALARTSQIIIDQINVGIAGLILSGGETAMAVLDRSGTSSIRPEVELDTLVMGGTMLNGTMSGTKIVTKGGLVGGPSILLKTMAWFYRRIGNAE